MRSILSVILVVALLAGASVPGAASPDPVHERNVAWMLNALGLHEMPEGEGAIHDGNGIRTVTASEAIHLAAARAGDVDLAALVAGASTGHGPSGVGDVWILEIGNGNACADLEIKILVGAMLPPTSAHPQMFTYGGPVGYARTHHPDDTWFMGTIFDWSTKGTTGGAYSDGDVEWWGKADFWCTTFFNFYMLFPYVNGYARHIH